MDCTLRMYGYLLCEQTGTMQRPVTPRCAQPGQQKLRSWDRQTWGPRTARTALMDPPELMEALPLVPPPPPLRLPVAVAGPWSPRWRRRALVANPALCWRAVTTAMHDIHTRTAAAAAEAAVAAAEGEAATVAAFMAAVRETSFFSSRRKIAAPRLQ